MDARHLPAQDNNENVENTKITFCIFTCICYAVSEVGNILDLWNSEQPLNTENTHICTENSKHGLTHSLTHSSAEDLYEGRPM